MRIISGSARGRKLADFSGLDIRPTPDRVREAVFSLLTSYFGTLNNLRVLELFAGSGALSLEALSRGAQRAILVDSGAQAIALIKDNLARCHLQEKARILHQSAQNVLPLLQKDAPFDLIFMDPPYHQGLIPALLHQIATLQLLDQNGIIIAETAAKEDIALPPSLIQHKLKRYGSTRIHLIIHAPETGDPA
jgi:16S rRNA (guanine(966)-N(2))-methyltransferase RsmD